MLLNIIACFFIILKKSSYLFFALALSYIIYNGDISSAFNIKLILFSLLYDTSHSYYIKDIYIEPDSIKKYLSLYSKIKNFDLLYFNLDEISSAISSGFKSFLSIILGFFLLFLFWIITPFYYFVYTHYFWNLIFLSILSFYINSYLDSKLLVKKILRKHDQKGEELLKTLELLKKILPEDQFKIFFDNILMDFFNKYKISDLNQLNDNWKLKRKFTVYFMKHLDSLKK